MYDNVKIVLSRIQDYFSKRFKESFNIKKDNLEEYVDFKSKNYQFRVHVGFIQARIETDLQEPIETRLDGVLNNFQITKGKMYELSQRQVIGQIPSEYYIE